MGHSLNYLYHLVCYILVYSIGSIGSFQYYYVALIAVGFTAVFELMMVWFKETPRWLLSNGCEDKTIAVLRFLRGPEISFEKELNDMKENLSGNTNLSWLQVLNEFKRRSVLIPFLIMAFIMFFQQVGGLNSRRGWTCYSICCHNCDGYFWS